MNKNKIVTYGIILFVLVGLLATYLILRNKNNTLNQKIDTSNWKPYINQQLGFSLLLPPEWSVDNKRSNRSKSGDDVVFKPAEGFSGESHEGISVDAANGNTADDYISKIYKPVIISTGSIMIDGEVGKYAETSEFATTTVFVVHKDKIYTFTSQQMVSSGILSTFKFLN